MTDKIDDVTVLPWLEEAMEVYRAAPDKIEHLLMWCYAKGVNNTIRAFRED